MVKTPIIWRSIDDLNQWDDNPNEGDIGAIIQSIKQFGYNDVSAIWNNDIRGGNHRIKALQQLRHDNWQPEDSNNPSQFLTTDNDIWSVACFDVSHMEKHEADAFALALNRTSRLGYDEPGSLLAILDSINASQPDILDSTGYTLEDMDYLNDISAKQTSIQSPVSTGRILGDSSKQLRPVIYTDEIATFEMALRLTKLKNRGQAIIAICAEYIANHEKR